MTVAERTPIVQTPAPAQAAYRAHVFSDCLYCAHGHDCVVRDELDYLADVEAFAKMREASRG